MLQHNSLSPSKHYILTCCKTILRTTWCILSFLLEITHPFAFTMSLYPFTIPSFYLIILPFIIPLVLPPSWFSPDTKKFLTNQDLRWSHQSMFYRLMYAIDHFVLSLIHQLLWILIFPLFFEMFVRVHFIPLHGAIVPQHANITKGYYCMMPPWLLNPMGTHEGMVSPLH